MKRFLILFVVLSSSLMLLSCSKSKTEIVQDYTSKFEYTDNSEDVPVEDGQLTSEGPLEYVLDNYSIEELLDYYVEDGYSSEDLIYYLVENEQFTREEILASVLDKYSHEEVLDYYVEDCYMIEDLISYLDAADMTLLCDEIESQGYSYYYKYFYEVADLIGYSPANFFGDYCLNKNKRIIHHTESECLRNIPFEDVSFVCTNDLHELISQTNEEDSSLFGYSFCPDCFDYLLDTEVKSNEYAND